MPPNYQFFQFGFDLSQGPEKHETMENSNNETNVVTHCCIFVDHDKILNYLITLIIIFSVRSVTWKYFIQTQLLEPFLKNKHS